MIELSRELAAAWWRWFGPLSVQGGLLILAVGLVDRLLPRRIWPELRSALWTLALAKLVLPPTLTSPVSLSRWLPGSAEITVFSTATSNPNVVERWALWTVAVWAIGLLLLTVVGIERYRRLSRRWRKVERDPIPRATRTAGERAAERLGLGRVPEIVISPAVASPFVAGLLRPRVYLPRGLGGAELEHVLLHELAHVRRKDTWRALATLLIQLAYWFHPLVWIARRRLATLGEQCCDRAAARALGDPKGYRRTLLAFAAKRLAPPAPGLGFVRPRHPLLARLEQLEHLVHDRPKLRRAATAAAALLMLACGLPMARSAETASAEVANLIERPPGCLTLRYMVMGQMAQEQAAAEAQTSE